MKKLTNSTWVMGETPSKKLKEQTGCWADYHKVTSYDVQKGRKHNNNHRKGL